MDSNSTDPAAADYAADCRNLAEIQRLLDEAYDHYFKHSDGDSRPSEGYIGVDFNTYFDRRDGEPLKITGVQIFSYVFGPHRTSNFASTAAALEAVRQWKVTEQAREYSDDGPCPTDHVTVVLAEAWNELMQDTEPEPNQALQEAAERRHTMIRRKEDGPA